ncbi:hypothetical protein [Dokdonia sp. Asnod2-E02]|uniref:hypothetical protein n=1 Tax=Dokdonia sp. Asnod2-E02 TaxID=3160574 RepID=UPI0038688652
MKKSLIIAALAVCTATAVQAQEKVEKITKTRTTVKSSLGNETVYKTVKETEVTPTSLKKSDQGQLNQSLQRGKTMVKKEVTYTYNDSDFRLEETQNGYAIKRTRENNTSEYGTMRKLAKGDVYLMKTKEGISVNYFDKNGNMVSEKYNDEDDTVTTITYEVKPNDKMYK